MPYREVLLYRRGLPKLIEKSIIFNQFTEIGQRFKKCKVSSNHGNRREPWSDRKYNPVSLKKEAGFFVLLAAKLGMLSCMNCNGRISSTFWLKFVQLLVIIQP